MIREATPADLPRLATCAQEFYASSKFLKNFNLDRFTSLWSSFIAEGIGVVFVFEKNGELQGAIGGMRSADLYSGDPYTAELFWFIREGHRGAGLQLYRAFEKWSRTHKCKEIRMIHLSDSMPERLERVYKHLGFELIECHYGKQL
jgi:RimJ/RimL family protein N-acetyltransferase